VANNLKRTFDATAISTNGAYNVTLDGISVNRAYSAAQNLINSVMGACAWNAIFKICTWENPRSGHSRSIEFMYNGTNWLENSRTAQDVPN
jgi:hypothetical protein